MPVENTFSPTPPQNPNLSIIIASYNSGNLLEKCLESLAYQEGDSVFETIVVDSSTDGIAQQIAKRFPWVRYYYFKERKFCGDARNVGISLAQGDIIAFIDADCRAGPNWINEILNAHQSPRLAIGGAIANGNPESVVSWAAYFCEFSQWMPGFPLRDLTDIAGANITYKRKAFEEYGPLLESTYCSDTDFHWRLRQHGHALRFVPSLLVSHDNIDQLGRFLIHEYEHGRSFARVRLNHFRFSKLKRWIYVTLSFLIPFWLFSKIGQRNFKNRIYLPYFVKSWPLTMLGLVSWSLGECIGYLNSSSFPQKPTSFYNRDRLQVNEGKNMG